MTQSKSFDYTVNGSPEVITLSDTSETTADNLLYKAGYHRYSRFNLYTDESERKGPLDTVDLSECTSYIAIPLGTNEEDFDSEYWKSGY